MIVPAASALHAPDVTAGARWIRVDLHLHSPGVHSFRLPTGVDVRQEADRERLADLYVEQLVAAGIEIAAITDYQGVRPEFFGLIAERAAARGVMVLPGAEMSVNWGCGKGVHLLLVAGPGQDPATLAEVIRHQGKAAGALFVGRGEHDDVDLRVDLPDTLRNVRQNLDCVIVAAHADDKNGVLKSLGPKQTAELVRDGLLDAVDGCEEVHRTLAGTGVLSTTRLRSLACTLSSDPKALDQVGTKTLADGRVRATWLKLSSVTPAALRLALHDPATRVRTAAPDPPGHPRILSLEVEGGDGYLSGLVLRFNDDLTALIGGRGAGKSAVLEVLRHVLGAATYSEEGRRTSQIAAALGVGGRARVVIERPGPAGPQHYEVTRLLDQAPVVHDLTGDQTLDVSPTTLFGPSQGPIVLLQGEIQAVAASDAFRRTLLDEIVGEDARLADRAVAGILDELRRNARDLNDVERSLAEREGHLDELHRLDAEIAYFDNQGVSEKLRLHADASTDRATLDAAAARIDDLTMAQRKAATETAAGLTDVVARLAAPCSADASDLTDLAGTIRDRQAELVAVQASAAALLDELRDAVKVAEVNRLTRIATLDADLARVRSDLGGTVDTDRFLSAHDRRTTLRPVVEQLELREQERTRLITERDVLLTRIRTQRQAAGGLRASAASALNGRLAGRLHMGVAPLADRDEFVQTLTSLLKGSRLSSEAVQQIARTPSVDGAMLARAIGEGAQEVQDRFGLTDASAQRLVGWFTGEPERLRAVDTLAPHDRVSVALVVDERPRDLAELSGGQRATAVLLLMFAQGDRPLVLDQPEDDLDNRFIYDDVVGALRSAKGLAEPDRRRQVIVATHNANIPVNGDAELVLSLADTGGRVEVRTQASIDDEDVRREIRTVLEGGAEAFARRAEKYGGLDDVR